MSLPFESPVYRWRHEDDELGASSEEALVRCDSGALWSQKGGFRARLVRALCVRSVLAAADLSGEHPEAASVVEVPDLSAASWPTVEHEDIAAALLTTFSVLAHGVSPRFSRVLTVRGEMALPDKENAGAWQYWAVGAVVILGAAAYAYACSALGEDTNYVADRANSRKELGNKLAEVHAALLRLAEQHAALERAAGKTFPMNSVEIEALAMLKKEQEAFLKSLKDEPPYSPPSAKSGLSGLGTPLALFGVGLIALFLTTRNTAK